MQTYANLLLSSTPCDLLAPCESLQTSVALSGQDKIVQAGRLWPRDYADTQLNGDLGILQELPAEKKAVWSKQCGIAVKNKFQIIHGVLTPTLAAAEDHLKRIETLRGKFNQDCKRFGVSNEEWQAYRLLENKKRKLDELFGSVEEGNKKPRSTGGKAKPAS